MMHEETKKYLADLVIKLHYKASQTGDTSLRAIADDISDLLKKDKEK